MGRVNKPFDPFDCFVNARSMHLASFAIERYAEEKPRCAMNCVFRQNGEQKTCSRCVRAKNVINPAWGPERYQHHARPRLNQPKKFDQ